ncbi:MAG: hypothetical protein WDW38_004311 [Sanguina aurantia]
MARPSNTKLQLPSLETGPVPLLWIRTQARRQLLEIIDARRGKKVLILDKTVSGPISVLDSGLSELLLEHGVSRLLYLDSRPLNDPTHNQTEPRVQDISNIVYILRPTVENAQVLAQHIKACPRVGVPEHAFSVHLVPRRTIAFERVLEEEGVLADVVLGEFPLDLIPYDDDVLSLEMPHAFKECVVDGDSSSLFYVARAIMKLQHVFGDIPRLQGQGPAASAVRDMCLRMRREAPHTAGTHQSSSSSSSSGARISRAILIDREVDLITPMMSQITFEGLIDEVVGIEHGAVVWQPKDKKASEGSTSADYRGAAKGGSTLLNSTDPFYKEFRDLPYHTTISRLQAYAKEARREYSELGSKDISELKSFVKGLPKVLLLDRLSDIAAPVAEAVRQQLFHDRLKHEQDCVDSYDVEATVGFIQVRSDADSRSSPACGERRHLDPLRLEVLHSYGHEHLTTLNALEKAGLLRASTGAKSTLPAVRKAFKLISSDEETNNEPPTDISHIYKGYAPLSIRLVEVALRTGWGPLSEVLLNLPGGHFDVLQTLDSRGMPTETAFPSSPSFPQPTSPSLATPSNMAQQGHKTVLVVFIGGVTFSEISALRFLSTRPDTPQRFLILTTKIINGSTLLSTFIDTAAAGS